MFKIRKTRRKDINNQIIIMVKKRDPFKILVLLCIQRDTRLASDLLGHMSYLCHA